MSEIGDLSQKRLVPLPVDRGDGPFIDIPVDWDDPIAAKANHTSRVTPDRDSRITGDALFGRPRILSLGTIHVSDKIPPSSFRRVYRSFRVRRDHPEDKNKNMWLRFIGNSSAIIDSEISALAGPPKPVTSTASIPHRTPRPDPPDTRVGKRMTTFENALETAASIITPTASVRLSAVNIIFRYPTYEPWGLFDGKVCSPEITKLSDSTKEFSLGNSSSEIVEIEIPYPVGRSVPVIFDIVNEHTYQAQITDFTVEVLLASSNG